MQGNKGLGPKVETSLLTTKLYVPQAQPGLVTRSRLLERLRIATNYRLVIVSAPAGFGKTTLVSEWGRNGRESASLTWLSLDQGDNDPVRFWSYFIAAIRTLQPSAGETAISLLHSPEPCPTESILTSLINDLSPCTHDFVVVLDDYHLIRTEQIHSAITFLLDHLPPRMHLVIAARNAAPLPLARFRGNGTLLEIGADDLRFTVDEAATLLTEVPNVKLVTEDIAALNARTDGWAVGLAMAALAMSKQKDVHRFVANFTGSQRYVMDYLIEEVLRQQTTELQDFLLKTSVLERLTASLCAKLTGQSESRELLTKLESAVGGFLVPLDETGQWYRYHHLLSELLRHQLEMQSGTWEVTVLHRRASQWYEDNGFPDDAVLHALKGRDWDKAICLIENVAESLMLRGEMLTLLNWLRLIPEATLRTNNALYRRYTDALIFTGDLAAAEPALTYLEQTAGEDANLQGENMLSRANIAWSRGDILSMTELSKRALALLPAQNLKGRTMASWIIGRNVFSSGFFNEAEGSLSDAYDGAVTLGNQWIAGGALSLLGAVYAERGRLHHAEGVLRQAIEMCAGSPASAMPECALSYYLYERNDLEEAARLQQRVIELCRTSGDYQVMTAAYSYLAYTKLAQGDLAGAAEAIGSADQYAKTQRVPPPFRAQVAAYGFLMAIRQDDSDAIAHWSTQVSEYGGAMPIYLSHVPSRTLIARGDKGSAAEQLQELLGKAVEDNRQAFMLRVRIYQVLAATTPAEALTFLTKALTLGQPEGFIRSFVDEGKLLAPLLRKAQQQGTTPEYTAKLLSIIASEGRQRSQSGNGTTAPDSSSGLLSERELEVLRLLAAGLPNREIAGRLFVSAATVKVHVHHILSKLNARSRTQAGSLARDLNLL